MKNRFNPLRSTLSSLVLALCATVSFSVYAGGNCSKEDYSKLADPCTASTVLASKLSMTLAVTAAPVPASARTTSVTHLTATAPLVAAPVTVIEAQGARPALSVWHAGRDASLRDTLDAWAARAGWQAPTWTLSPEKDFTLGASLDPTGDYATAVNSLFEAFPPEHNLRVHLYRGNNLTIVEQTP